MLEAWDNKDRWIAPIDFDDAEVESELEGGLGFARNSRHPDPADACDYMYARPYAGLPARGTDE